MKEPPSEFRWVQRYAGKLSPDEAAAFDEYLQQTPSARREDEENRALHQRLQRREGFEALLQQGLEQLHQGREGAGVAVASEPLQETPRPGEAGWWSWLSGRWMQGLVPAAAGLCVLAVMFSSGLWKDPLDPAHPVPRRDSLPSAPRTSPPQAIGGKAGPSIGPSILAKSRKVEFGMLFMRRGTRRTYKARPHQVLSAGDLIQFVVQTGRPIHVMIASLNAKGHVSRYVPFTGPPQSVTIAIGKGQLPKASDALELDGSVGPERLFFVYGSRRFSYRALKKALQAAFRKAGRRLDRVAAIAGPWRWRSLMIHKRPQQAASPTSPDHQ